MKNSNNNTIILNSCVKEFKEQNELNYGDDYIFELFVNTQITKNHEFSFDEIENGVVDGSLDGGIDTIIIVANGNCIKSETDLEEIAFKKDTELKLIIAQSKVSTTHTEAALDKIITSIPFIFTLELDEKELSKRFNSLIIDKISIFHKAWNKAFAKNSKISVNYFYCSKANKCQLDSAYISKTEQIIKSTEAIVKKAKEVTFNTYSALELLELYQQTKTTELDIKFKEVPTPISYKDGEIGFIGVVKLNDYFEFIRDKSGKIREILFESNIRHYQGNVDVNKKIKQSLLNDYERDFWWLNNGITIIASEVRQLAKRLSLTNVQIVNGLQTSYTIGKYYDNNNDEDRSILVKIIVNKDKETIDKIISSTNRQNPVSPTLLRATDDTQRKIEIFFEQKGFYYDRRKNFYKNQGKPASKIFSIQTSAQAIHSIMNYQPGQARQKPTTLIKTETSYKKIFNSDTSFDIYLNCCLIHKKISEFVKNNLTKEDKSFTQSFMYHLCRISTSKVKQEAYYSKKDLKKFNVDELTGKIITDSLEELQEFYASFQNQQISPKPLNAVTKSGPFEDFISAELVKKYQMKKNK
jgi:hypothetical protein